MGTGADYQARRLMEQGSPFPCLVDPTKALYGALGLGRLTMRHLASARTYSAYWKAFRRGARQGRITGDPKQLSGLAVFDAGGRLARLHRSATVGDYPPIDEVLAWVADLRSPEDRGHASPR